MLFNVNDFLVASLMHWGMLGQDYYIGYVILSSKYIFLLL